MWETLDLASLDEKILTWFESHVWTMSTFSQSLLIAAAFLLGAVIERVSAARLVNGINQLKAPVRIKQILHNLRRLVLPLSVLILLFMISLIEALGLIPGRTNLVYAAMSLLFAWIIVRLAVQFIGNSFIRNLFALTIWGIAALTILGVLDETARAFDAIGMNIGTFRLSVLTVIKGLFVLFFLLYAAGFVSSLAERRIRQISGLTISSKVLMTKTIRIVLITIALLIGVTSSGIDLSLLAVFSGALGLGVGFGLQKGLSNLFSGMLLLLDKSIKPGDIIELQDKSGLSTFGWVHHMGARYTEIITRENKSFLIPNEDFITQQVVNWSHGDTLIRLEAKFHVHYKSDPHLVKKLAEEAATRPSRVVAEPKPVCHLIEFGDSGLKFSLRFWIKDAEQGITNMRGEVMLALWDIFRENGIEIPYPQQVLHISDPVRIVSS